ncbi:FixH family protein [uncultured Thiothrix sp.]|uniref:FixH family protein n=1 Tax=uncultured Thiothrix sp. TaxID=223185 RepID=UPI00260B0C10|nr:FixH family protein [uncultured Thiothrix sp.]
MRSGKVLARSKGIMNQFMLKTILILSGCLSGLVACQKDQAPMATEKHQAAWELTQTSSQGLFTAQLMCKHLPSVGPFQDCQLTLANGQGQAINDAKISIEGGMPSHGHGLPTAPVVSLLDSQGHYRIDGLQYNMPGSWLLGFMIQTTAGQDKVVFSFEISNIEKAACAKPPHLPAS